MSAADEIRRFSAVVHPSNYEDFCSYMWERRAAIAELIEAAEDCMDMTIDLSRIRQALAKLNTGNGEG